MIEEKTKNKKVKEEFKKNLEKKIEKELGKEMLKKVTILSSQDTLKEINL